MFLRPPRCDFLDCFSVPRIGTARQGSSLCVFQVYFINQSKQEAWLQICQAGVIWNSYECPALMSAKVLM